MSTSFAIRTDPLSGESVFFAENRAARPNELAHQPPRRDTTDCPFCARNESKTPKPVLVISGVDSAADWKVRVVPNKFPALSSNLTSPGTGLHDVFIESPEHLTSFTEVSNQQARWVFQAFRDRLLAASKVKGIRFAQLFKNEGQCAGASLEHIHSQLVAFDTTPQKVRQLLNRSEQFYQQRNTCYYCDLLKNEIRDGSRIVNETEHFIAYCPFASRFAFETWILPTQHANRFEQMEDEKLFDLACVARDAIKRIQRSMDGAAYNLVLRNSPFDLQSEDYYHWHLEILPRITNLAGFEIATGSFINSTLPEKAAHRLRTCFEIA